MSWHYVRVRPDKMGALRHPETGGTVVPDPRQPYRSDDPLVKAHPDVFCADTELEAEHQRAERPIEQATRAPGERRATRR